MKVYIVMQEDRGYGQTVEGVFLSKEAAEKEYGELLYSFDGCIYGNYWLEEHEVVGGA